MFNITRQDLAKKSDAQLKSLFNQAQKEAARAPHTSRDFNAAQSALTIISQELRSRGLCP